MLEDIENVCWNCAKMCYAERREKLEVFLEQRKVKDVHGVGKERPFPIADASRGWHS